MTVENMILFLMLGALAGWIASRTVNRSTFALLRDALAAVLSAGHRGWSAESELAQSVEPVSGSREGLHLFMQSESSATDERFAEAAAFGELRRE